MHPISLLRFHASTGSPDSIRGFRSVGSAAAVTASSSPLGHGVGSRSRRSRRVTALPLHMQGILLAWSRRRRDSDEANRYAAICGTQVQPGSIEGGFHTAMYGALRCRPGGPSALAWRSGLGPRWWSPVRITGDLEGCFRLRLSAAGGRRGAAGTSGRGLGQDHRRGRSRREC